MSPTDFEARYQAERDPFGVRTSEYERRKLGIVLAGLTQARYRLVWDAACGTGDLALELTRRADALHASDAAPTAVRLTAELLQDTGCALTTEVLTLPDRPGRTGFDLVVLSEVMYYLDHESRCATYALIDEIAAPDAELVTVTWRHHPGDAHLSGAEATTEIADWFTGRGWRQACTHDDIDFCTAHLVRGTTAPPSPTPLPSLEENR